MAVPLHSRNTNLLDVDEMNFQINKALKWTNKAIVSAALLSFWWHFVWCALQPFGMN